MCFLVYSTHPVTSLCLLCAGHKMALYSIKPWSMMMHPCPELCLCAHAAFLIGPLTPRMMTITIDNDNSGKQYLWDQHDLMNNKKNIDNPGPQSNQNPSEYTQSHLIKGLCDVILDWRLHLENIILPETHEQTMRSRSSFSPFTFSFTIARTTDVDLRQSLNKI